MTDFIAQFQVLTDELGKVYFAFIRYFEGTIKGNTFEYSDGTKLKKINLTSGLEDYDNNERHLVDTQMYYYYNTIDVNFLRTYYNLENDYEVLKMFSENMQNSISFFDEAGIFVSMLMQENKKIIIDSTYNYSENDITLPPLKTLEEDLNKYVIGQSKAIRNILINIYSHYKNNKKTPMLLHGPTGVGKTEILKQIADKINVPFIKLDLNCFSSAGYYGNNIEEIPLYILKHTNFDEKLASRALVAFDETDKVLMNGDNSSAVNKSDVVNGLLTFVEGHTYEAVLPPNISEAYNLDPILKFDTTNLCCVFLGAFTDIRNEHFNAKIAGYNAVKNTDNTELNIDILSKKGISNEFLGRIKSFIPLKKLTKNEYIAILKESKIRPFLYYKNLFAKNGKTLYIADDIYEFIAHQLTNNNFGARALDTIVTSLFEKIEYLELCGELPKDNDLTLNLVEENGVYYFDITVRNVLERKKEV